MSEKQTTCPHCGKAVDQKLLGLCPECMLKAGMATGTGEHARFQSPTIGEVGERFPQLEVLGLIGRGGMGAVYKARQKQLDRVVALKILPPDVAKDGAFAERFAREAKALAAMSHPNIVTLYEFGESDGLYFFLMEYVDGVNLRQLMSAGKLAPKEALAIVPHVCDALQYAHDRGIVHRDIKPENILIGRDGVVKIADFGVAKIVGEKSETRRQKSVEESGQTIGQGVVGTPAYMAPEQVERPAEVDHRADIYSLGVVLYQMLTGELPAERIEPPSRKVQIDVRIDEIVLRALEREPERRYETAGVMKTVVETVAAGNGEEQKAGSRKKAVGRSHWFWVAFFAVAAACALANAVISVANNLPGLAILWAIAAIGFALVAIKRSTGNGLWPAWLRRAIRRGRWGQSQKLPKQDAPSSAQEPQGRPGWRAAGIQSLLAVAVHLCLAAVIATVIVFMVPPIEENLNRANAVLPVPAQRTLAIALAIGRNEEMGWALLAADTVLCVLLSRRRSRGPLLAWAVGTSLLLVGYIVALLLGLTVAILRAGPVAPSAAGARPDALRDPVIAVSPRNTVVTPSASWLETAITQRLRELGYRWSTYEIESAGNSSFQAWHFKELQRVQDQADAMWTPIQGTLTVEAVGSGWRVNGRDGLADVQFDIPSAMGPPAHAGNLPRTPDGKADVMPLQQSGDRPLWPGERTPLRLRPQKISARIKHDVMAAMVAREMSCDEMSITVTPGVDVAAVQIKGLRKMRGKNLRDGWQPLQGSLSVRKIEEGLWEASGSGALDYIQLKVNTAVHPHDAPATNNVPATAASADGSAKVVPLGQGGGPVAQRVGWRAAYAEGQQLASRPPDQGLVALRERWPTLDVESRQQMLKAFAFAGHDRLVDVLDLGMRDSSPAVQNWAIQYLRSLALRDSAEDFAAYGNWYAGAKGKTTGDVFRRSLDEWIDGASNPKVLGRGLTYLSDALSGAGNSLHHISDAEMEELRTLLGDVIREDRAAQRVTALKVARCLPADEQWQRNVILPVLTGGKPEERIAAVQVLGRPGNTWAVAEIVRILKASVQAHERMLIWTAATALGEMADPKVIPELIELIAADNTYDTVYGIGYFALWRLTGVEYGEKHDGAWWRQWWKSNAGRFGTAAARTDRDIAAGELEDDAVKVAEAKMRYAQRVQMHRELRDLGQACTFYATVHDGMLPQSLEQLRQDETAGSMIRAVDVRQYELVATGKLGEMSAGTMLFSKSADGQLPADRVLIRARNTIQGRYQVVYADGHTGSINAPEAQQQATTRPEHEDGGPATQPQ